jgi:hypothetical protein
MNKEKKEKKKSSTFMHLCKLCLNIYICSKIKVNLQDNPDDEIYEKFSQKSKIV